MSKRRTPAAPVPRRRPQQGGYARGDETRAQIIDVALQVFGERGFDQASTRDIAAQAQVTPPALQYYFGSKEGLHLACAQSIVDRARPRLQPVLERAVAVAAQGTRADALDALGEVLDALTDKLAEPGAELWSRFIMRGKHDGAGPGIDTIREQLSEPMFSAVAGLIGVITGTPPEHELNRLRTAMVFGQIHWMHARREEMLRVLHWSELSAAKIDLIKQTVREQTRRALEGIAAESKEGRPRR